MVLLSAMCWQGCAPSALTEPGKCQGTLDCPGSMICVAQQCVSPPLTTPDASNPPEVRAETTPEKTPEAKPEKTPEGNPETNREAPPTGDCKPGETKACDGGCGKGTQTCTDQAKWGPCWPESKTKSCYTGPSGTENKGECKAGTQTCVEGSDGTLSWGKCEGEVLPTAEVCDSKDNDCDGSTDNSAPNCDCKPGETRPCGKSEGECKQGTETCKSDKTWGGCVGAVGPTAEVCDDKDNNCDGQIDETFSKKGQACSAGIGECRNDGKFVCSADKTGVLCDAQPGKVSSEICNGKDDNCNGQIDENVTRACYTMKAGCQLVSGKYTCQGNCSTGTNTCSNGSWSTACTGEITPQLEVCRDRKDNDCDGLIDETCGTSLLGVTIKSDASIIKDHTDPTYKTSVGRKAAGFYTLYYGTAKSCADYPLFLTAHTFVNKPIAYTCNGNTFEIRVGAFNTTSGALADNDFSAVLPPRQRAEVWGVVDAASCATTGAKCKIIRSYGSSTVTRVGTGVYELNHSACNVITRPAFVTIYDKTVSGYASIIPGGSNLCRVYTYNLKGSASDRSFAFWLPPPDQYAWASVSISLGIAAQNNFKDQQVKWSGRRDSNNPHLYDISYGSFANPSAVLVSPHIIRTSYSAVAGFTTAVKQGVRVSSFQIGVPPANKPVNFSVMFIQ